MKNKDEFEKLRLPGFSHSRLTLFRVAYFYATALYNTMSGDPAHTGFALSRVDKDETDANQINRRGRPNGRCWAAKRENTEQFLYLLLTNMLSFVD